MKARSFAWVTLLAALTRTPEARAQLLPAAASATVHSRILGEDRTVFVALPASYAWGSERYPVIYLTDAVFNFAHTRSSAQFLARNRMIPEVIIVGVTNPDRTRDLYATQRGLQTQRPDNPVSDER